MGWKKEEGEKVKRLLALLFAAALCVSAQTPDNELTAGAKNGRWWAGLSSPSRLYYLVGLRDGMESAELAARFIDGTPPSKPYVDYCFAEGETFGEAQKGLDQFYEEPANAAITIIRALRIFRTKIEGATAEQLAGAISDARRQAVQMK